MFCLKHNHSFMITPKNNVSQKRYKTTCFSQYIFYKSNFIIESKVELDRKQGFLNTAEWKSFFSNISVFYITQKVFSFSFNAKMLILATLLMNESMKRCRDFSKGFN